MVDEDVISSPSPSCPPYQISTSIRYLVALDLVEMMGKSDVASAWCLFLSCCLRLSWAFVPKDRNKLSGIDFILNASEARERALFAHLLPKQDSSHDVSG